MTAPPPAPAAGWPEVRVCDCQRLEQEHRLSADGTRRLGTDNGACPRFHLARVEERPPEPVLRARLAAVASLARLFAHDPMVWCQPSCLGCVAARIAELAEGTDDAARTPPP